MTSNVDLAEPALVAGGRAERLGLVAEPLGVAREHVVDVAREERGLVAAGAGPQLDDDVALVVRVALDERQAQLLLDRRERLLAARELGLEVGAHLGVRLALEHPARVRDALAGGAPALRRAPPARSAPCAAGRAAPCAAGRTRRPRRRARARPPPAPASICVTSSSIGRKRRRALGLRGVEHAVRAEPALRCARACRSGDRAGRPTASGAPPRDRGRTRPRARRTRSATKSCSLSDARAAQVVLALQHQERRRDGVGVRQRRLLPEALVVGGRVRPSRGAASTRRPDRSCRRPRPGSRRRSTATAARKRSVCADQPLRHEAAVGEPGHAEARAGRRAPPPPPSRRTRADPRRRPRPTRR